MIKEVEIKVEVLDEKELIMRQYVGDATGSSGEVYELNTSFGSMSPIIKMPNGEIVAFDWKNLINAANKALEVQNG